MVGALEGNKHLTSADMAIAGGGGGNPRGTRNSVAVHLSHAICTKSCRAVHLRPNLHSLLQPCPINISTAVHVQPCVPSTSSSATLLASVSEMSGDR